MTPAVLQTAAEARLSTRTVCDTVARQELATRKWPQRRVCQPALFAILSNDRKYQLANGRRGANVDTHRLRYCRTAGKKTRKRSQRGEIGCLRSRYCCTRKLRTCRISDTVVQFRGFRKRECTPGDAQAGIERRTTQNVKENGWFWGGYQNQENQPENMATLGGSMKLVNGRRGAKSTRIVCDTVARQKYKL